MLKFEKTNVFNFDGAFRGMRNPMDSWGLSDSTTLTTEGGQSYILGNKDLELAKKLINAGSEHRKFLRQIMVCVDITAPRWWWAEFDTYKVGTTANSCSTMHKIHAYPFSIDMFSTENCDEVDNEYWGYVVKYLELLRLKYKTSEDPGEKIEILRKIKTALPESFIQKRTVTLNYENIHSMRDQRATHRMSEWYKDFIEWSDDLPYAEVLFNSEV